MSLKSIELPVVKISSVEYDKMEARIRRVFLKQLYRPLLIELSFEPGTIQNAKDSEPITLLRAIASGRITFSRGTFRGQLDATTTKELRKIGAKWDKKTKHFRIAKGDIPPEYRAAIATADVRYKERIARIDEFLKKIMPAEIAEGLETADLFDSSLEKMDRNVGNTLRELTVYPALPPEQRAKIAEEWQNNMNLWVSNFAEKEIKSLRKDVAKSVMAGNRREALAQAIQRSYGVTTDKANFLAKQETSLLMAKFKETRYTNAGVHEYKWACVAGSVNHPVRPSHKILEGKTFRWDTPPITTPPNQSARRNNPGQDYNCRCNAIPIIRFNT